MTAGDDAAVAGLSRWGRGGDFHGSLCGLGVSPNPRAPMTHSVICSGGTVPRPLGPDLPCAADPAPASYWVEAQDTTVNGTTEDILCPGERVDIFFFVHG